MKKEIDSINDLKERYIYAVYKNVPAKKQQSIAQEVRLLIDDTIDAKGFSEDITLEEFKTILKELGTPTELAIKYDDSEQALISQPYFSKYKFFLKIVLLAVFFGMSVASVPFILENNLTWYGAIGHWASSLFSGCATAFAMITVFFYVFQRLGVKIDPIIENIEDLPPVPDSEKSSSKIETIISMCVSIIFTIFFVTSSGIFKVIDTDLALSVSVFNPEKVKSIWYLFFLSCLLSVIRDGFKLLDGKYSTKLVITTVICNVGSGIIAFFVLLKSGIFNPEFPSAIAQIITNDADIVSMILSHLNSFLLIAVWFALLVEIIVTLVKTGRRLVK